MLWTPNGRSGIHWKDLAGNQEIEEHPNCREMLFHRGSSRRVPLDVCSDHYGIDLFERLDALPVAPCEELRDGLCVRGACVFVSDRGREEFDETPGRSSTGATNDGWNVIETRAIEFTRRNRNDLRAHGWKDLRSRRRPILRRVLGAPPFMN